MSLASAVSVALVTTLTLTVSTPTVEGRTADRETVRIEQRIKIVQADCPEEAAKRAQPRRSVVTPKVIHRLEKKETNDEVEDTGFCGASMNPLGEETACQFDMLA